MPISGPKHQTERFLRGLDAKTLVEVTADLLTQRGHRHVRITDGPADGGRDIHSVDPRGRKHLTQCKYHKDFRRAVSSREVAELPMAMIKFGYGQGLFVTSARISPQSKREFLSDYRDLSMDFMEGSQLATRVLHDVLLRAIWVSGARISRISYAVSIPVLARDLVCDRPISLEPLTRSWRMRRRRGPELPYEYAAIQLRIAPTPVTEFAQYHPPARKTASEGWGPVIRAGELLITELQHLGQLPSIRRKLISRILHRLMVHTGERTRHIAVRFGTPSLTPLSGRNAGASIKLGLPPLTLVHHDGETTDERDWLLPSMAEWRLPHPINATTAGWVRWYHPAQDVCLDVRVVCEPSDHGRSNLAEQAAWRQQQWEQSIFALVSTESMRLWRERNAPLPNEVGDWYEGRKLCCWYIPTDPMFRAVLVEPDELADASFTNPFAVNPEEIAAWRASLTSDLTLIGAEVVDPSRARHMYALIAHDPIPEIDQALFRSVDLLYNGEEIPSPINPDSRELGLVVCWRLTEQVTSRWADAIRTLSDDLDAQYGKRFRMRLVYDDETRSGTYVTLYLDQRGSPGTAATDTVAAQLLVNAAPVLKTVEGALQAVSPDTSRTTADFWRREVGLLFTPHETT